MSKKQRKPRALQPEETGHLGYTVWLIMHHGGSKPNISRFSESIGVSQPGLSAFLHGRGVTRKWVASHGLAAALEKTFPSGWDVYGDVFSQKLGELNSGVKKEAIKRDPAGRLSAEPRMKKSFGHALWDLIGRDVPSVHKAAALLDLRYMYFANILKGNEFVTQKWVREKNLYGILRDHFPEGWAAHGETLMKFGRDLSHDTGNPSPRNGREAIRWRKAVGALLRDVFDRFAAKDHRFSETFNDQSWNGVVRADPNIPVSEFKHAIERALVVFDLKDRDALSYHSLRSLKGRAPVI